MMTGIAEIDADGAEAEANSMIKSFEIIKAQMQNQICFLK